MDLKRAKMIQARVWPHGHNDEFRGPHDVKIGITSQPTVLRGWDKKHKPLIALEQPQTDESNFTVLRIFFGEVMPTSAEFGQTWHKANVWGLQEVPVPPFGGELSDEEVKKSREAWRRLKPSHLTVYIKTRYSSTLKHPIPLGKWEGTVIDDEHGGWALFTLQAVTLAVQPVEKKRSALILPGDPEWTNPSQYKKLPT